VTRKAAHPSRGSNRASIANTSRSCGAYRSRANLPAHHDQLMPQNRDLDVLGVRCGADSNEVENPPDDHKRQRANHHDG
jgi:hypothetical protein